MLENISNIKFHENPSNGNRVVPCGQRDRQTHGWIDRETHMTKLIVAFRNFANSPNKIQKSYAVCKIIIGNLSVHYEDIRGNEHTTLFFLTLVVSEGV